VESSVAVDLTGEKSTLAGERVAVLCSGKAPRATHAGVYLVDRTSWSVMGSIPLPNKPHSCRTPARRGCAAAMQLRMAHRALTSAAPETHIDLSVSDWEAFDLLVRWQKGDTTPPEWYSGGDNATLNRLARWAAANRTRFTPLHADLGTHPFGRVALRIMEATRLALYSHTGTELATLQAKVTSELATLPA
jgi:hypothetical protein